MLDQNSHRLRRLRAVRLSAIVGIIGRVIAMMTVFISYPATLKYLGAEQFGLWMIVSSFNMAVSFSDLGLGNGLLTMVAEKSGQDDFPGIRRAITSAYMMVSAIAFIIFFVIYISIKHSFWPNALGITDPQSIMQLPKAIMVFAFCFTVNIPLSIASKIQTALQRGYSASAWQAFGSILSLLFVLLAVRYRLDVSTLIAAFMSGNLIANAINTFFLFYTTPDIRPKSLNFDNPMIKELMKAGFAFFILQLVISFSFGYDAVIVSRYLGPSLVPDWALPERLFSIIGVFSAFALQPLWPAYREAIARGDSVWVKKVFFQSLLLTIVFSTLLGFSLVLFVPFIFPIWVGNAVAPGLLVAMAFAIWRVVDATYNCLTTFLNGLGRLSLQVLITSVVSAAMLGAKLIFVPWLGIVGIPLGSAVAVGVIGIPFIALVLKHRSNFF